MDEKERIDEINRIYEEDYKDQFDNFLSKAYTTFLKQFHEFLDDKYIKTTYPYILEFVEHAFLKVFPSLKEIQEGFKEKLTSDVKSDIVNKDQGL